MIFKSKLFYIVVMLLLSSCWCSEESRDTREGEDVTLECRFNPPAASESLTYYWVRNNPTHDNVAIGAIPLASNYKLDYRPEQGRYDLLITNATYERENGYFECRVKLAGSGQSVHAQGYQLTVLTVPQPPRVYPGARVQATEGREQRLSCSSIGASPDPVFRWYRDGSTYPLEAEVVYGKSRTEPSNSTLVLNPGKEDDGAVFRCVVWNRALSEGVKLETTITLDVNYFPRVEVGPENPLKVEVDGSVIMECKVDSKPKVSNVRWTRNNRFISPSVTHTLNRVTIEDSGKYTCSADNGLGKIGEQELFLDVLFPPSVVIESKTRETEEGGMVNIRCNVTANPEPISIEWTKEGKADFRQSGESLRLPRVTADSAGTYICKATNIIVTAGGKRIEKTGTSSVAVLVRHKPGKARISPDRPIAQEGSAVTLSCAANPPGWPTPQYKWFRDGDSQGSQPIVLAMGPKYAIPSAHLGSEGTYHCQATNVLGHGEMSSINLEVHQPPRFQSKLQPHMTRRSGDSDFSVSCSAHGKPKPSIKWLKDGSEITPEPNLYEVRTENTEGRNSVVNVHSTLKFNGKARIEGNQLLPEDRGVYSCVFENEVKKTESSMHLRIEHEPITLHQYNKVAYDLRETAEVVCKMQAYPKPEFQWSFGTNTAPLFMSSEGHYEINTTTDNNDMYTSILKVSNIKHQDYGDYYCRVINTLGSVKAQIKLQPKGPPEKPRNLQTIEAGHNFVTLLWEPGFDGGLQNTKYFVSYRRVAMPNNEVVTGDCSMMTSRNGEWMEFDCSRNVPCNVTALDQHQTYVFKVKALNAKGSSDFSNEIATTTKVDKIPSPDHVTFDPSTRTLSLNVGSTCLALVGVVESLVNGHTTMATWQVVETIPLHVSGNGPTYKEAVIDLMAPSNRMGRNGGRSLGDEINDNPGVPQVDELNPRVRVKLCLRVNHEHCGEYTEAEIGPSYIKEASALATPTLIAIIVSCIVFILFIGLLLMFCRCKRNQTKKQNTKDYEMESMRPSMVAAQNQAPPPYYPATGLENKALEHSMDLALSMEDPKNAVYATQNGYGYHVAPNVQGHPGQNINGGEWVNMGYMENSYSNSNNGGSVNSQDSLWQMKMAAAANNGVNNMTAPHPIIDRQNSYGYDPIAHGGYGAIDDYAPYPHMTHNTQPNMADEYNMRGSQNPSRQEYCTDPYASVHKPKKRMDQQIESPYHDVSGLPDPYMDHQMETEEQKPPQHLSLSYDESLESGYSTPNSRTRRVIREIIV
ncbi:hemicentin protein echinoid isoform X2 [Arctopsyche grandis]|uniref:hemicentin protein echinoid isoform X2 n=1 Tax=Arctopsyche grandis TaxID=121162 RepID=UPI00406D6C8D